MIESTPSATPTPFFMTKQPLAATPVQEEKKPSVIDNIVNSEPVQNAMRTANNAVRFVGNATAPVRDAVTHPKRELGYLVDKVMSGDQNEDNWQTDFPAYENPDQLPTPGDPTYDFFVDRVSKAVTWDPEAQKKVSDSNMTSYLAPETLRDIRERIPQLSRLVNNMELARRAVPSKETASEKMNVSLYQFMMGDEAGKNAYYKRPGLDSAVRRSFNDDRQLFEDNARIREQRDQEERNRDELERLRKAREL